MTPTPQEQAIFRTIAWFSLFSYPLTTFEIWKWLFSEDGSHSLSEVDRLLAESAWLSDKCVSRDGFFTLQSPDVDVRNLISRRQCRFLDAQAKYKQLRRAAHWFRLLPGVRAVAAVNTLAHWNTGPESDIDLFIVVRPGTIWSSRLFATLPFFLTGRRPKDDGTTPERAPFCLSFFATTDALNFEPIQYRKPDPYLAIWIASLVPIIDKDDIFSEIIFQNQWLRNVLPHTAVPQTVRRLRPRRLPHLAVQPTGGRFEWCAKRIQTRQFPEPIRRMANRDTRVVVTDDMLKFHQSDRRKDYCEAWESCVNEHIHHAETNA